MNVVLAAVLAAALQPPAPPQRIISLSPSVTEILYGVGAFDRVVAVSTFCDYPPEVEKLPRVGGWTNTNLEQVLSLSPDLVIFTDAQAPLVENRLRSLEIHTLAVESQTLEDIFDGVETIGRAVGNASQAATLNSQLRAELEDVSKRTAGLPRPSVLVVVDRLPGTLRDVYVATGHSYLTSLVTIAGGDPITPDASHNYVHISSEALVSMDPEAVFDMVQALNAPVAVPGVSELAENPTAVWQTVSIRAVRDHRVYSLTDKRLVHPSQLAIRTAREMAMRLHPEAFSEKK
jgi:ABC-type Fe3+-hydroxamate transport system substrate-binding protein